MSALENNFVKFLKRNLKTIDKKWLEESAIPSLIHKNQVVRWFFWQRIYKAINLSKKHQMENILDFGAGSGVILPFLPAKSNIYALDLNTALLKRIKDDFKINNLKIIEYRDGNIPLPSNSMDFIFALEVLEHISKLDKIVNEIYRVCKQKGILLISLPTENLIYKLGRKAIGFRNEYHRVSSQKIISMIERDFVKIAEDHLYQLAPFYIFKIYQKVR